VEERFIHANADYLKYFSWRLDRPGDYNTKKKTAIKAFF
jgi:hypothetical protein